MPKIVIAYESIYGNTKQVAETIAEGMKEKNGTIAALIHARDVDAKMLADYDVILIGGPNHMGGPTGPIKKIIKQLAKQNINGKKIGFFDTYQGDQFEKAAKKMEALLSKKGQGYQLIPALSIKVGGMKGPIVDGELRNCRQYGAGIA